MTVKELKNKLNEFPDTMEVFLNIQSDFDYSLADQVRSEEVKFAENPDFEEGEELAKETVVVIYGC